MNEPRPLVVVTGRRRPHEQGFLIFGGLVGLTYLAGGAPPPTSVAALMPHILVSVWAGGLVASGVVGLVGCWSRQGVTSLRLEQGGMLIGAGALIIYTVAVFTLGGWRALFGGGIAATFAIANLIRAWQVARDIRAIRKARQ